MAGVEQLAQGAHQLGDVVEVQPGRRLVEQEQRAAPGRRLARAGGGIGQETGQLEALRLAARQRGHRLAEPHVVEADVDDGLQPRDHLAVVLEPVRGLGHGQVQHVGDAQLHRPAHHLHVQDLGPVAAAVAVRAAQVDVAEELHLHVLEARATAGRAAAVAGVEAEGAGAVAALARERGVGEDPAQLVEGADVAGRVAARGLADRALVDEDGVAQPVGAEQALKRPRGLGRLAEVPRQRRVEHVLDQRALARAADAGDDHQPLQRQLDRDVAQVVVARAFEHELGRRAVDQAPEARTHVLAATEVGAGQRVGVARLVGRAVEDDSAATLARPRAHVDEAVGGEHHRRIVLDDDQRVAGVAQPVHRLDDAVHVARVQADAGLVEHEHRVHQRGAQRGGQVDALHLAAAERAALAVQRQVLQADVAQVLQPRAHFVQQQLQGFVEHRARQAQAVEEAPQAFDRQLHQVVQVQARQRLELRARPGHADRHEALLRPAARRRRRPSSRCATAAPRASAARRRTPCTACSCGTSTRARGCASCRPCSRGSRRSGARRTTACSSSRSSAASPR